MLDARRESILFDVLQSEEGGRFFREQNRNLIIFMDENFPNQLPDNYIWMTLNQLIFFNQFNNYLNIQARSLIAAISFS
jgi:oxidase EvaA